MPGNEEISVEEARRDALEEVRAAARRPSPGVSATLSGPAEDLGGASEPSLSESLEEARRDAGFPTPGSAAESAESSLSDSLNYVGRALTDPENLGTAAEVGASLIGARYGGKAVGAALRTVLPESVGVGAARGARAAIGAGRAAGAGAGSMAASETFMREPGETEEQANLRRGIAAATGMGGEALGPVLRKPVEGAVRIGLKGARSVPLIGERLVDPFQVERRRLVREMGRETLAMLRARGVQLPTALVVDHPLINVAQNIAEGSLTGRGGIEMLRQDAVRASIQVLDEVAEGLARNVEGADEAGMLIEEGFEGAATIHESIAQSIFNRLDDLTADSMEQTVRRVVRPSRSVEEVVTDPGSLVPRVALRHYPAEEVEELVVRNGVNLRTLKNEIRGQWAESAKASKEVNELYQYILKQPDEVTFAMAQQIRSALGKEGRIRSALAGARPSLARRGVGLVDDAMEERALTLNPEALGVWRLGNEVTKEGKELFNESMLARVVGRAEPEQVWRALVQKDTPTRIRQLYSIVNDPRYAGAFQFVGGPQRFWENLQGEMIRSLKSRATKIGTHTVEEVDGKALLTDLQGFGRSIEVLFPDPAQQRSLTQIGRAIQLAQSKPGSSGTGRLAIQFGQFNAIGMLTLAAIAPSTISGYDTSEVRAKAAIYAGGLLLGPKLLSRALRSETFTNLVLDGITGKKTAAELSKVVGQIATHLIENRIPFAVAGETPAAKQMNDHLKKMGLYDPGKAGNPQQAPQEEPKRSAAQPVRPAGVF